VQIAVALFAAFLNRMTRACAKVGLAGAGILVCRSRH
jgi:hypothetical protein